MAKYKNLVEEDLDTHMDGYRQTSEEYDSFRNNEDDSLREPPKGKPKIKVVS